MKTLAGVFSFGLFVAAVSGSFSTPAFSKQKAKPGVQQSSRTKPVANEKKCDQTAGNNHNSPCY